VEAVVKKIEKVLSKLRRRMPKTQTSPRDAEFAATMFLDGCFLLQYMVNEQYFRPWFFSKANGL
jgi:hypothetical protein